MQQITDKELNEALVKVKLSKAPSNDKITSKMIKFLKEGKKRNFYISCKSLWSFYMKSQEKNRRVKYEDYFANVEREYNRINF